MSELELQEQKSYITQVIRDTFVRWGARVGLAWIAVIVLFAAFAPLLVNSMPFVIKYEKAGLKSPFLTYLTTFDAMMFLCFFVLLFLLIYRNLSWMHRVVFFIWSSFTGFILTFWAPLGDMLLAEYPKTFAIMDELLAYEYALLISIGIFLVLTVFTALIYFLGFKALAFKKKLTLIIVWAALLLPWVINPVNPPLTVVYDEYRRAIVLQEEVAKAEEVVASMKGRDELDLNLEEMEALDEARMTLNFLDPDDPIDKIEWKITALIPFSPWDNSYDNYIPNQEPNDQHWLGTDNKNVDVLGRMIYGCRIALTVGFISTAISLILGIIIGGLMGFFAGWVDLVGMRLVEIFSSIPSFFLILAFIAFYGRNLYMVMLIIGLVGWPGYAMFIRAEYLKLRKLEYVQAASALGLPLHSVLFKHILPNGIAPTLVSATFGFASAVSTESVLSFLSLVDAPSWGQLLSQAIDEGGGFYLWVAFPPGLAIFFTVFGYNLIGESLRDAIDPRIAKK